MRSRECPLKLREERVHAYYHAVPVARGREAHHGLDQAVEAFPAERARALIEQGPGKLPGAVAFMEIDSSLVSLLFEEQINDLRGHEEVAYPPGRREQARPELPVARSVPPMLPVGDHSAGQ
jgi:hypothetical protein